MTPKQFKSARKKLGLSQKGMAELLRLKSSRSIRYYESGERDISGPIEFLVEKLLKEISSSCP